MFVLRAAQVFDGARAIPGAAVVVEGGTVVAVEERPGDLPPDAHLVDFGDATLLPGLIDSHVHLGFDSTPRAAQQIREDDDGTLLLRMRQAARRHLSAGVTTVRDLGDRNYLAIALRDWFRTSGELAPEILTSGPPITVTGGHCYFLGGEADGEQGLRLAVRTRATRGVDVIKIMVTGGNMTAGIPPWTTQYTTAEVAAVVEEAHRFGRPVTAHVHGATGIELALEAGVDGLEHCSFWTADGVHADPSLIDRIVERGVAVCPTAGIVPMPVPPPPAVAARLPAMEEAFGRLHRAGVRLLAGTDGGVAPPKPHGISAYAVRHLADVGLSRLEGLQAATSWSAEACGLAGRKGVLAPGADADILVVGGDATEDLRALHDVRAVFRAGVLVGSDDGGQPATASMARANLGTDRSTMSSLAVSEMRK